MVEEEDYTIQYCIDIVVTCGKHRVCAYGVCMVGGLGWRGGVEVGVQVDGKVLVGAG